CANLALLAGTGGTVSDGFVPHSRGHGDVRSRSAAAGRFRQPRPESPADAGRGVFFRRGVAAHLGGSGFLGARGGRRDGWTRNVLADAGAEVASGRGGVLSSRW